MHTAPSEKVEATATARGVLLAKKYGKGIDREEASRLDILTERLRNLAPRVTADHTNALALLVDHMEQTAIELLAIEERYAQP